MIQVAINRFKPVNGRTYTHAAIKSDPKVYLCIITLKDLLQRERQHLELEWHSYCTPCIHTVVHNHKQTQPEQRYIDEIEATSTAFIQKYD